MIKNKVNFTLINVALITVIIFFLFMTSSLWIGLTNKILSIIGPFFFAFIIAYALSPFLEFLQSKKIPKALAVIIVLVTLAAIFGIIIWIVCPLLFGQLSSLFNGIISFVKEISLGLNINVGSFQESLSNSFNSVIESLGKYISNGAISAISISLGYISIFLIAVSAMVYILIDMDDIKLSIKKFLKKRSTKAYRYFSLLDDQMKKYLVGFVKIMCISLFEYTIIFFIIGHPNFLLLGFLAAIMNVIPYFGGMITNTIAAITAFVISPALFIRTVITFIVLSVVDGNIINPLVYGKTNKVHPLILIFGVFAGGSLFGIVGIILSLPGSIILISTYKYFKGDITDKIEDIKLNKSIKSK